nr:biotin/lipoyl-binding protein [Ningiella sp. W23]
MIKTRCFTQFNLISITFLLLLAGCSESEVTTEKQNEPRAVKLITIGDESQSKTLTYPATIDTINSSKLAFQVSGKLEALNVIAAQNVNKGDVIAVLEQRNFINEVKSSKIQFETADNDYQRGLKLVKDGVISQRDIEQLKSKKK